MAGLEAVTRQINGNKEGAVNLLGAFIQDVQAYVKAGIPIGGEWANPD